MTFKILEELQVFRQGPPSHVGRIFFFFQGHLVLAVPMGERIQEGCREKTWMHPPRICWIKFLHLDIIVVPLCWDFLRYKRSKLVKENLASNCEIQLHLLSYFILDIYKKQKQNFSGKAELTEIVEVNTIHLNGR